MLTHNYFYELTFKDGRTLKGRVTKSFKDSFRFENPTIGMLIPLDAIASYRNLSEESDIIIETESRIFEVEGMVTIENGIVKFTSKGKDESVRLIHVQAIVFKTEEEPTGKKPWQADTVRYTLLKFSQLLWR